ncbi:hypothetical protein DDE18_05435 [Nocardioides gansuensis]|uniref:Uncharacterized protein n=2 Tax=Nocardioides gansuensis TaxID=2138300 RepID=A0A2T8FDG9_9ACTN|nr:hypothetical protein DDE18_05435 [Nocardioides gansuensis]
MADWSLLRALLAPVTDSVTLSWEDLDALVGGLPPSAYTHSAFWKGARSGWPGFSTVDVRVGESVTFLRSGAARPSPTHRPLPRTVAGPDNSTSADVILIGCVKRKLPTAAPAKDLYVSPLFRKGREYAENAGVPWFILSAQHDLVAPDEELEPYDLRLGATSQQYRREWGGRVVEALREALGSIDGLSIEVHAGSAYVDAIREGLRSGGATVVEPLAGLGLGPRLAWYGDRAIAPAPSAPRPDLDDLIARLLRADKAISPEEFLATGATLFRSPGLYSWWVDVEGAADLETGLRHPVEPGLIYAGLAGATRSGGRKSKNTLWGRIKTMHLGGRHEFSTFRLSLGSVLAESRGDQEIDEPGLTAWMHEHLRLIAVPVNAADTLGDVETEVLQQLDPPLNLDKVARNALRIELSALRKRYGRKRRTATATPTD